MTARRDPWEGLPDPLEILLSLRRHDGPASFGFDLHADGEPLGEDQGALPTEGPPGARLHALIDGKPWARAETCIAEALRDQRAVRLVVRSKSPALLHEPWEQLRLSDQRVLAELPGVVVVRRWTEDARRPPPRDQEEGARWLLAGSGDVPHEPIAESLREAGAPHVELTVARVRSLPELQAQLRERPHVLQLLAHADGEGLHLGESRVPPEALATALGEQAEHLRCVLLTVCSPKAVRGEVGVSFAERLHRAGIELVIAPPGLLLKTEAVFASQAIARSLLTELHSVEAAWRAGRQHAELVLWAHPSEGVDGRPLHLAPYRGLQPFEARHRPLWFGREAELAEALSKLEALEAEGPRLLFLYGASGLGKSSLARAGLVPSLEARGWRCAVGRPSKAGELRAALDGLGEEGPRLLVVDQLEEVFTYEGGSLALLEEALARGVFVVPTLLPDESRRWAGATLCGRTLDQLLKEAQHRVWLAHLGREAIEEIVRRPAERVGLRFEGELAARVVSEVEGEPGSLPLLEFALQGLWERREGSRLTYAAWDTLGGVKRALEVQGEAVLRELGVPPGAGREALEGAALQAHDLLVGLVDMGEDGRQGFRRRRRLSEVRPYGNVAEFDEALKALVRARLIVLDDKETEIWLELAHETLCRHLHLLTTWVKAEFDKQAPARRTRRLLRSKFDTGGLLDKHEIKLVVRAQREHGLRLDTNEETLLSRSREAEEKRKKDRRRARSGLVGVVGLAASIVLGVSVASVQQAHDASIVRAVEKALNRGHVMHALLWLRMTWRTNATPGWRESWVNVREHELPIEPLPDDKSGVLSARGTRWEWHYSTRENSPAFIDSGDRFVLINSQGDLEIRSSQPGTPLIRRLDSVFENDGKLIAIKNSNQLVGFVPVSDKDSKSITLINVLTGERIPTDIYNRNPTPLDLYFMIDQDWIAYRLIGYGNGEVNLFNLKTKEHAPFDWLKGSTEFGVHDNTLYILYNNGDILSRSLPLTDPSASTPTIVVGNILSDSGPGRVHHTQFISDTNIIAKFIGSSSSTTTYSLLSVSPLRLLFSSSDYMRDIGPSGGGDRLIRVNNKTFRLNRDGTLEELSLDNLKVSSSFVAASETWLEFSDHRGQWTQTLDDRRQSSVPTVGNTLSVSNTYRTRSVSSDLGIWLAPISPAPTTMSGLTQRGPGIPPLAMAANGDWLIQRYRGTYSVRDASTLGELWEVVSAGVIGALTTDPTGQGYAVGRETGKIQWIREGPDAVCSRSDGDVYDLTFSPDGERLASSQSDGWVRIFDRRCEVLSEAQMEGPVDAVAFSLDGVHLYWGTVDGTLWRAPSSDLRRREEFGRHRKKINDIKVGPRSGLIISGSKDHTVQLRRAEDGLLIDELNGHKASVIAVDVSADERMIASGSGDHTVRVWDRQSAETLHVLRGDDSFVSDVAFYPDGERIAFINGHGGLHVQPIDLDDTWPWRQYPYCLLTEDDLDDLDSMSWLIRLELALCPLRVAWHNPAE